MSNLIPPMLSNSPPPIDIRDSDEEDDDFCNFRVADLNLHLSDVNNENGSPDKWESPTSEEPSMPIPQSPSRTKSIELNSVIDVIPNDSSAEIKEIVVNGDKSDEVEEEKEDNQKEAYNSVDKPKPPDLGEDSENVDEIEELGNIPFPPVFSPCVTPPQHELRTSPEGADSDEVCTDESEGYSWSKVSFPDTCDLKSDVNEESNLTNVQKPVSEFIEEPVQLKSSDDFGDFADFSSQAFPAVASTLPVIDSPAKPDNLPALSDGDDDFDAFESAPVIDQLKKFSSDDDFEAAPTESGKAELDDDFDKFESAPVTAVITSELNPDIDDDFDDFESAAPVSEPSKPEGEALLDRVSALFARPPSEPEDDPRLTGCLNACLDDSSSVWGHLKDLETSQALKLQWSTSTASKKLLSSLNIDSRNILIGARWNGNVPRFAANLSCAPLEPVQAESMPSPVPSISRVSLPSSIVEDVVPAAQFDWNGSGLTNPLDCTEKFENIIRSASEPIVNSSPSEPPLGDDIWSSPHLPTTDVLLPAPVDPHPIELDAMLVKQLTTMNAEQDIPLEPWIPDSILSEESKKVNSWTTDGNTSSWTISSQLETKSIDVAPRPQLSAEACRVVETLPDLSFLSARKLLYSANENMGRFQRRPRL